MYKKIESIKKIDSLGLNRHKMIFPKSYNDYINCLQSFEYLTIRTDHFEITENLPFYIINVESNKEYLDYIWTESLSKDLKLILSNGIQYDNIQEYNMVVKIQKNGDFIFEASSLKIPLRNMYKFPNSLLSTYGNICDSLHEWVFINDIKGIDRRAIKRDLQKIYSYGVFDRYLELTKYPIKLGILNDDIAFWQIQEEKRGHL